MVSLSKNSSVERKKVYVHRLVAEAFLGPIPKGMEVNHKDSCRSNAHADNLEIVTHTENMRHCFRNGLGHLGEKCSAAKLNAKQVLRIRELRGLLTTRQIARAFGISPGHVSMIWNQLSWSHLEDPSVPPAAYARNQ